MSCWKVGWQGEALEVFVWIYSCEFIQNVNVEDRPNELINIESVIIPSLHQLFLNSQLLLQPKIRFVLLRGLNSLSLNELDNWFTI